MTRIRANCPSCGEVDLRPDDIELEIVRSAVGEVGDGSNYRFCCPDCTELVRKPADERIARLLATGGVAITITRSELSVEDEHLDVEDAPFLVNHPEQPVSGPDFTPDDLLDFHLLLQDDGWFDHLSAMTS